MSSALAHVAKAVNPKELERQRIEQLKSAGVKLLDISIQVLEVLGDADPTGTLKPLFMIMTGILGTVVASSELQGVVDEIKSRVQAIEGCFLKKELKFDPSTEVCWQQLENILKEANVKIQKYAAPTSKYDVIKKASNAMQASKRAERLQEISNQIDKALGILNMAVMLQAREEANRAAATNMNVLSEQSVRLREIAESSAKAEKVSEEIKTLLDNVLNRPVTNTSEITKAEKDQLLFAVQGMQQQLVAVLNAKASERPISELFNDSTSRLSEEQRTLLNDFRNKQMEMIRESSQKLGEQIQELAATEQKVLKATSEMQKELKEHRAQQAKDVAAIQEQIKAAAAKQGAESRAEVAKLSQQLTSLQSELSKTDQAIQSVCTSIATIGDNQQMLINQQQKSQEVLAAVKLEAEKNAAESSKKAAEILSAIQASEAGVKRAQEQLSASQKQQLDLMLKHQNQNQAAIAGMLKSLEDSAHSVQTVSKNHADALQLGKESQTLLKELSAAQCLGQEKTQELLQSVLESVKGFTATSGPMPSESRDLLSQLMSQAEESKKQVSTTSEQIKTMSSSLERLVGFQDQVQLVSAAISEQANRVEQSHKQIEEGLADNARLLEALGLDTSFIKKQQMDLAVLLSGIDKASKQQATVVNANLQELRMGMSAVMATVKDGQEALSRVEAAQQTQSKQMEQLMEMHKGTCQDIKQELEKQTTKLKGDLLESIKGTLSAHFARDIKPEFDRIAAAVETADKHVVEGLSEVLKSSSKQETQLEKIMEMLHPEDDEVVPIPGAAAKKFWRSFKNPYVSSAFFLNLFLNNEGPHYGDKELVAQVQSDRVFFSNKISHGDGEVDVVEFVAYIKDAGFPQGIWDALKQYAAEKAPLPQPVVETESDSTSVTLKWDFPSASRGLQCKHFIVAKGDSIHVAVDQWWKSGVIQDKTYCWTGLEPQTPHHFAVCAVGLNDQQTWSKPITMSTKEPQRLPAPQRITVVSTSTTSISLRWQAPMVSAGQVIRDYDVAVSKDGVSSHFRTHFNTEEFTIPSLTPGTAYKISVAAVQDLQNARQMVGEFSASVDARTTTPAREFELKIHSDDLPRTSAANDVFVGPAGPASAAVIPNHARYCSSPELPLTSSQVWTVGRQFNQAERGVQIVLQTDAEVSRKHAVIAYNDRMSSFTIKDFSTFGTFLRLKASQACPLRNSSKLVVGRVWWDVVIVGNESKDSESKRAGMNFNGISGAALLQDSAHATISAGAALLQTPSSGGSLLLGNPLLQASAYGTMSGGSQLPASLLQASAYGTLCGGTTAPVMASPLLVPSAAPAILPAVEVAPTLKLKQTNGSPITKNSQGQILNPAMLVTLERTLDPSKTYLIGGPKVTSTVITAVYDEVIPVAEGNTVEGAHALIKYSWDSKSWMVVDLGRNPTFVSIPKDEEVVVDAGQSYRIGLHDFEIAKA